MVVDETIRDTIRSSQRNEITEYHVYSRLAKRVRTRGKSEASSANNRAILEQIAQDELKHYEKWKEYTGEDISPAWGKVFRFYLISRLLGLTFGLKFMEQGEKLAQATYEKLVAVIPEAAEIEHDENEHENALIGMIDEERLHYAGSMVLGLNDALVELTGALAGFTFALGSTGLVALTGLITGIAAALSMAASEYLSIRTEEKAPLLSEADSRERSPARAALYTGIAYIATVFCLILPYLLIPNTYGALGVTLLIAILIIAGFNYYVSVAMDKPFRRRFLEMATISLGVAALSFGVGYIMRALFGIEA